MQKAWRKLQHVFAANGGLQQQQKLQQQYNSSTGCKNNDKSQNGHDKQQEYNEHYNALHPQMHNGSSPGAKKDPSNSSRATCRTQKGSSMSSRLYSVDSSGSSKYGDGLHSSGSNVLRQPCAESTVEAYPESLYATHHYAPYEVAGSFHSKHQHLTASLSSKEQQLATQQEGAATDAAVCTIDPSQELLFQAQQQQKQLLLLLQDDNSSRVPSSSLAKAKKEAAGLNISLMAVSAQHCLPTSSVASSSLHASHSVHSSTCGMDSVNKPMLNPLLNAQQSSRDSVKETSRSSFETQLNADERSFAEGGGGNRRSGSIHCESNLIPMMSHSYSLISAASQTTNSTRSLLPNSHADVAKAAAEAETASRIAEQEEDAREAEMAAEAAARGAGEAEVQEREAEREKAAAAAAAEAEAAAENKARATKKEPAAVVADTARRAPPSTPFSNFTQGVRAPHFQQLSHPAAPHHTQQSRASSLSIGLSNTGAHVHTSSRLSRQRSWEPLLQRCNSSQVKTGWQKQESQKQTHLSPQRDPVSLRSLASEGSSSEEEEKVPQALHNYLLMLSFEPPGQPKQLLVSRQRLGRASLTALSASIPATQSLRILMLNHSGITDQGIAVLRPGLMASAQLWVLDLRYNKIGDDGATLLASCLPNLPQLNYLILTANRLSDFGVDALRQGLQSCNSVCQIRVDHNPGVSEKAAREFGSVQRANRARSFISSSKADDHVGVDMLLGEMEGLDEGGLSSPAPTPAAASTIYQAKPGGTAQAQHLQKLLAAKAAAAGEADAAAKAVSSILLPSPQPSFTITATAPTSSIAGSAAATTSRTTSQASSSMYSKAAGLAEKVHMLALQYPDLQQQQQQQRPAQKAPPPCKDKQLERLCATIKLLVEPAVPLEHHVANCVGAIFVAAEHKAQQLALRKPCGTRAGQGLTCSLSIGSAAAAPVQQHLGDKEKDEFRSLGASGSSRRSLDAQAQLQAQDEKQQWLEKEQERLMHDLGYLADELAVRGFGVIVASAGRGISSGGSSSIHPHCLTNLRHSYLRVHGPQLEVEEGFPFGSTMHNGRPLHTRQSHSHAQGSKSSFASSRSGCGSMVGTQRAGSSRANRHLQHSSIGTIPEGDDLRCVGLDQLEAACDAAVAATQGKLGSPRSSGGTTAQQDSPATECTMRGGKLKYQGSMKSGSGSRASLAPDILPPHLLLQEAQGKEQEWLQERVSLLSAASVDQDACKAESKQHPRRRSIDQPRFLPPANSSMSDSFAPCSVNSLLSEGSAVASSGGGRSHNYVVVDPFFKDQFELRSQCTTPRYEAVLSQLPKVYVAQADRVPLLIEMLCQEMTASFKACGMPLPPWRKLTSLTSKWNL